MKDNKPTVFKRGDEVQWTSQAGGYVKKKRGDVHEVVMPGRMPRSLPDDFKRHYRTTRPGTPRNHRSYIVKTPDGKLYWPLVKYLKPVKSNGKGGKLYG